MDLRLFDAHNHLQDERLAPELEKILATVQREGVCGSVVNGSSEEDWQAVEQLAGRVPGIIPSFGYHPWYVKQRSPGWLEDLNQRLDRLPSAVGEIGLDRWVKDHDLEDQRQVFTAQLRAAAERDLPVSIHCLQAWGLLLEVLQTEPRPRCGFLLHSFGGPREMIGPLAELGAYFSLPGYFAHERKDRQREAFRHVPADRLLIETDAPDQLLPDAWVKYPLTDSATGKPLNHPGNLRAVYEFAAELYQESLPSLAARVERNFRRLFGRWFNSGATAPAPAP
jgi:TatD DNase family protein